MRRVHIDKLASATARLSLSAEALVDADIPARAGAVVAARVLEQSETYGQLEDCHGRMVQLHVGDVVAGVLGERRALHGHAGTVPGHVAVGDELHLLNLGGVIGRCTSSSPRVGPPVRLEILGAVQSFPTPGSRAGVPATLDSVALPAIERLDSAAIPPIIFVSGSCMNAGKTRAAAAIVLALVRAGRRVAAAKLTGVAARKDGLAMVDCGASCALTFVDAGLPSTSAHDAPAATRAVLTALANSRPAPDVIVAELGDGLLGEYGVLAILTAEDIAAVPAVHVCCANDPVGAWGAHHLFVERLGRRPDVFSGPVTDNAVGIDAIVGGLDLPAINARDDADALGACVLERINRL